MIKSFNIQQQQQQTSDDEDPYPAPEAFEVGSSFKCYAAHICASDLMYIIPSESPILPPNHFDHSHLAPLVDPRPGQACLAPYSSDGKYYRARVGAPLEDGSEEASVFFVDYGYSERRRRGSLLELPKYFYAPPQAVLCHVPGITKVNFCFLNIFLEFHSRVGTLKL